jgi:dihydrolipoamide dehydrogenase
VHEAALAMQVGATVAQMAEMIHAHPTLSEGMMEAAEDVEGKAIHQARKRMQ